MIPYTAAQLEFLLFPNRPVPLHSSLRLFSLSYAFTLKSFPGFSFKVIMDILFLRQESFLLLGRHTAKFTISLSIQQGLFNI